MQQIIKICNYSCIVFVAVLFTLVDGKLNTSFAQNYGQVSGKLINASGPLVQGTLAFFRADQGSEPADSSILRIPDRTALVDEQGRFAVKIQYGRYQLGYFPGEQKTHPGLPDKTIQTSIAGISESKPYILNVASPQVDTGDISFYSHTKTKPGPSFTVHGIVRNKSGKPVAGISVVAKIDLNTFRPQFISRKTDRSGSYTLTLPPGSYYLFARHRLEKYGRPVTGEYFGIWGVDGAAGEFGWFPIKEDQDIAIHGKAGQKINNADITVFRIPDPAAQEETLRSQGTRK